MLLIEDISPELLSIQHELVWLSSIRSVVLVSFWGVWLLWFYGGWRLCEKKIHCYKRKKKCTSFFHIKEFYFVICHLEY